MTTIILLIVVGLLLISLEIFVPGGILGLIGGVVLLAACITAYNTFGYSGAGIAFIASIILAGSIIFIEFKLLAKTKWGQTFFLKAASSGKSTQAPGSPSIVGKTATAATVLTPTGVITVDGTHYDAHSQDGHIQKGALLQIVGQTNFHVLVQKAPSHHK